MDIKFSDITDLISRLTLLFAVLGAIKLIFWPPKGLRLMLSELKEYFRLVKRVKLGSLEAEWDLGQKATTPLEDNPKQSATAKPASENETPGPPDESAAFFNDAIIAIGAGNYEAGMNAIRKAAAASVEPEAMPSFQAFGQYLGLKQGQHSALQDLKRTVDDFPRSWAARRWLGLGFRITGNFDESLIQLEKAAELVGSEPDRALITSNIAEVLVESTRVGEAKTLLAAEANKTHDGSVKSTLYKALAEIYENDKKPDLSAAMSLYELAVHFSPFDQDLRFALAYKYGDLGPSGLALHHYKILLSNSEHNSMALNNAGVSAGNLACR
jgi:tetratricopeptide (TPR) repeat protein